MDVRGYLSFSGGLGVGDPGKSALNLGLLGLGLLMQPVSVADSAGWSFGVSNTGGPLNLNLLWNWFWLTIPFTRFRARFKTR